MVALVGNPNSGKTALFNLLTGSRQKVANYAGVTVERKEGRLTGESKRPVRVLDLPGAYSLYPRSPDERVTAEVLAGQATGERRPDLVVCVVDATNLRRNLRLVLAVLRQGLPVVVALNMSDLAARRGLPVDAGRLAAQLGVPVVATVGVQREGDKALRELIADRERWPAAPPPQPDASHDEARLAALLEGLGLAEAHPDTTTERIDRVVLHPLAGPLLLATVLFLVFQAVFAWAQAPMDLIQAGADALARTVTEALPTSGAGRWLASLLADGLIAGVGGVLVFLPQILILFFFILALEESGYLPRAAFLLDRLMGSVGLSGRSFIPLLSSFACAIPGIMATRTIADPRDRIVTMLLAPLMTCSARLPVYTLLIGAFVPARTLPGGIGLQGVALFTLYGAGILGAFAVAWVLKRLTARGEVRMLMMELPSYHWPTPRHLAVGLLQRARIFLRRVGGVILVLTLALWFLASFPAPPAGATGAPIEYSLAGTLGRALAHLFEPIGFNWQISIALVPGLAAREVLVSSLGTVYALGGDDVAATLGPVIAHGWAPATAYALLAWFVFAPQCLSTLAAVRRETGGWRVPALLAAYLFALAYAAAFVTYRAALALGAA
ncbi:MAG TPA: ferrous iron transporter B [Burkholderiaceae bacterium]|nr:ferrous iron transporter B [Burkholderiaceae bacterium]